MDVTNIAEAPITPRARHAFPRAVGRSRGLHVARSLRRLVTTQSLRVWARVPAAPIASEFCKRITLDEGAGNAGCLLHPRSRVQKCAKKAHTSIQVQSEQSGIPCAREYRGAKSIANSMRCGWCVHHCVPMSGATSVQRVRTLTERVQATNQRAPALADAQIEFWRKRTNTWRDITFASRLRPLN